jgi:hypothetical protein
MLTGCRHPHIEVVNSACRMMQRMRVTMQCSTAQRSLTAQRTCTGHALSLSSTTVSFCLNSCV